MKRQNNNKIYRYSKINMAEILENLLMRRNENRRIVQNRNDIKKMMGHSTRDSNPGPLSNI